jgi:hypothetical protein
VSDKPDKTEKKPKKPKKGKGGAASDEHVRLSTHPGAVASVKRTRARCGLIGFALVLLLCLKVGVPAWDATVRALIAGIVAQLAGWFVAISVWRQVIRSQVAQAAEAYNGRMRQAHQAAAERATATLTAQQAANAEAEAQWAATITS